MLKWFSAVLLLTSGLTLQRFTFEVLGVLLSVHLKEPRLFFGINETAKISCLLSENNQDGGHNVCWYWKRREEALTFVKCCNSNKSDYNSDSDYKYNCAEEWRSATLEVRNAQQNDSGVYYCANRVISNLNFPNGSTLIVGDSYTARTSVLLVIPSPQQSLPERSVPLACVVRAVSGQVWVSWKISGVPGQGRMSSIRDRDGSWTFINHIRITPEAWTGGEVSCEAQFNSSYQGVKRSAGHKDVPTEGLGWCVTPFIVAVLLLCTVSVTIICVYQRSAADTHRTPRRMPVANAAVAEVRDVNLSWNESTRVSPTAPPSKWLAKDGIMYAHLKFETEKPKRKRARGLSEDKKK